MKYRKYLAADRGDCLAIFDSNARHHFAPTDRQKYERFLANPPGFYGVLCGPANQVVACGGVRVAAEGTKAVLTWGMVHAELQDEAISRALARARLQKLADFPHIDTVVKRTPRETVEFFPKLGFSLKTNLDEERRKDSEPCELETSLDDAFWQCLFEQESDDSTWQG